MAGFVFPEVIRTMSSRDWADSVEEAVAEKIIQDLQDRGVINENREFVRQDSKENAEDETISGSVGKEAEAEHRKEPK